MESKTRPPPYSRFDYSAVPVETQGETPNGSPARPPPGSTSSQYETYDPPRLSFTPHNLMNSSTQDYSYTIPDQTDQPLLLNDEIESSADDPDWTSMVHQRCGRGAWLFKHISYWLWSWKTCAIILLLSNLITLYLQV